MNSYRSELRIMPYGPYHMVSVLPWISRNSDNAIKWPKILVRNSGRPDRTKIKLVQTFMNQVFLYSKVLVQIHYRLSIWGDSVVTLFFQNSFDKNICLVDLDKPGYHHFWIFKVNYLWIIQKDYILTIWYGSLTFSRVRRHHHRK